MNTTPNDHDIRQAIRQMRDFDTYYRLGLWPAQTVEARTHDLVLMHRHGDLAALTTELLAADQTVLVQFALRFPVQPTGRNGHSTEVAWPLIDRALVANGRFLVSRRGREAAYHDQLQLSWNPAPHLNCRSGDSYAAGSQQAAFHVSREHRQPLLVKVAGQRGYAFAEHPKLAGNIFLHVKEAPPGFTFEVGKWVTALLVSTPQGVQARAILPA